MSAADGAPEIRLDHVRLVLGRTRFHFDCRLPAGAITAITGPSGSGKSTLLNLIAGFEAPDEGKVLFDGRDVGELHPSERPVSLIFQDHNLFGHLDIFTNVGLGINPSLALDAQDKQAIARSLERVGLAGMEKRMPATLSGGERQRVAFARALVREKPVLLLDEPFAALDPGLRLGMSTMLLDLHRETGSTILIVTHDPGELRRLASNVIFIDENEILVQAPTADFLARRDLPAVSRFLSG